MKREVKSVVRKANKIVKVIAGFYRIIKKCFGKMGMRLGMVFVMKSEIVELLIRTKYVEKQWSGYFE